MKKIFALIIFTLTSFCAFAQFSTNNSILRKAIVAYELDNKGYYQKVSDKMVDYVSNIEVSYAYDKHAQNLYVLTQNGNVEITLTKDYAKIFKKNKSIPQLKGNDLEATIQKYNEQLEAKFSALNAARTKHIQDSIAKVKADSIAAERRRAEELARLKKEREDYMKAHNWRWVPTNNIYLYCDDCEKSFTEDSLFTLGIKNDTIYYISNVNGKLGYSYLQGHKSQLKQKLKEYSQFKNHYEIYRDSLCKDSVDYDLLTSLISYKNFSDYLGNIKKKAPYGFFTDWGWGSEYSSISFHFNYMNTNSQTIKYIDVYFKVTNSVGDVRKTGHFQGTGPLAEFESATWEWDSSSYYVAGDASNMSITKVILTYMNGTKKVLTGNYLVFD